MKNDIEKTPSICRYIINAFSRKYKEIIRHKNYYASDYYAKECDENDVSVDQNDTTKR
jgi:hypothetical protein